VYQRAKLLGEEDIKAPPRSIFDYISAKNKDRLSAFRESALGQRGGAAPQPSPSAQVSVVIPALETPIAIAALKGFMPFVHDPGKQERYRAFLEYSARAPGDRAGMTLVPPKGMSVEEFNSELESFTASARIFKPMTGMMASRFTSSKTVVTAAPLEPGLRKPVPGSADQQPAADDKSATTTEPPKDESPAAKAARLEMFGALTRTSTTFCPVRLLCKRFNVPDPWPEGPPQDSSPVGAAGAGGVSSSAGGGVPASREALNQETMDEILQDRGISRPAATTTSVSGGTGGTGTVTDSGRRRDLAGVGLGEDEAQGRDTLTYERPSMDIFAAIFADDEDDEDDEADVEDDAAGVSTAVETKLDAAAAVDPFAPKNKADVSVVAAAQEEVDPSTFRPTFVSKRKQPEDTSAADMEKQEKKKKKKDKKARKVSTAAVSFDFDEDDAAAPPVSVDVKSKKRKPRDEPDGKKGREDGVAGGRTLAGEEEEVWVEKETNVVGSDAAGAKRRRMHAADFL
jgi:G patch domain-containing protein 1